MKVFNYTDCVVGEKYFFVYDGVVYYGEASKEDWDADELPTQLEVKISGESTWEKKCLIWDADLIYQL